MTRAINLDDQNNIGEAIFSADIIILNQRGDLAKRGGTGRFLGVARIDVSSLSKEEVHWIDHLYRDFKPLLDKKNKDLKFVFDESVVMSAMSDVSNGFWDRSVNNYCASAKKNVLGGMYQDKLAEIADGVSSVQTRRERPDQEEMNCS